MELSKITNPTVKNAIEALQANDLKAWYSHFTDEAVFTDDGRNLDFKSFFDNAFDKKEKFLTIDKVENDGKNIYGNFYAGQWGTFNVFFKFTMNDEGKISRLDIGQTK
ncbi:nuclear transport factor 2-like protein [Pararhodonellum marinum]|uniref:nuclear transport factor 2 family protein n=1 Tax=Pararhodonellum marinum TaxID=2755358 RepID=UPI00188F8A68|nr:nuclear transport factor 2 family protein [Pararhodonellum marinum]